MASVDLLFSSTIISGSGAKSKQNCSVELLGKVIYGDMRHGYHLPCIDPGAQAAAVAVQDRLADEARNSRRWRLLIARLGTCHKATTRVQQRMALWAARSVEHLSDDPRVKACNDTTERWLADPTDENAAQAARAAGSARDDTALIDWYEQYLDVWHKIAVDEGCAITEATDAEYAAFVADLDRYLAERANAEV